MPNLAEKKDFAEMLFDSNQYTLLESTYKKKYKKYIKTGMLKLKNYHKGETLKRARCLNDKDFKVIEDLSSNKQSSGSSSSLTDSIHSSKTSRSGELMDRLDASHINKERIK